MCNGRCLWSYLILEVNIQMFWCLYTYTCMINEIVVIILDENWVYLLSDIFFVKVIKRAVLSD